MFPLDQRIEGEIASLGDLTRQELVERWVKVYGCIPPKGVKRGLLERAAAWHLQDRHLGGFSSGTRRSIRDAVRVGIGARPLPARQALREVDEASALTSYRTSTHDPVAITLVRSAPPRPGARLIREWNGRTHIVDVIENGFVFDGKTYRSLTAIAKRITGVHWSGPRFFGL